MMVWLPVLAMLLLAAFAPPAATLYVIPALVVAYLLYTEHTA